MHVNPRPASVQPYQSSLYLPGSLGRYRQYPRVVNAPIPGTGYDVSGGTWGEQTLYMGGYGELSPRTATYPYGKYTSNMVPLRGLGQAAGPRWYEQTWVWATAGAAVLLLGVGSFMALRKNGRRSVRRNRRSGKRSR